MEEEKGFEKDGLKGVHYQKFRQKGLIVWFTGLSGSGKTTITVELEKKLLSLGWACYRLDGDNIRQKLNCDLGFSAEDRMENVRRVAEVATIFQDAGMIVLVALITPYRSMRDMARKKAGNGNFLEIYLKTDIETCSRRDPKGLYARAKSGEIKSFTGISDIFEEPTKPDIVIDTQTSSITCSVNEILESIFRFMR